MADFSSTKGIHQKIMSLSSAILWICLGPNQTYFARFYYSVDYSLSPAIRSKVEEIGGNNITAIALGINETYVIVHGNKWIYDLKGHYGSLTTKLDKSTLAPRVCFSESLQLRLSIINVM